VNGSGAVAKPSPGSLFDAADKKPAGKSEKEERKNESRNTGFVSAGKSDTVAYIRARLERDAQADTGKAELLAKVERGEMSTHRAAVETGFRRPMIQIDQDAPATISAEVGVLRQQVRIPARLRCTP
jgi:hypothetical protein